MQLQSVENRRCRGIVRVDGEPEVPVLLGDIGMNIDNIGDGIGRHIHRGRDRRANNITAGVAARMTGYLKSPAALAFKNTALIIG